MPAGGTVTASSLDRDRIAMLVEAVRARYPQTEAIYVYGSAAQGSMHSHSDVDIALLLPHDSARTVGSLALSELRFALEESLGREVDLVSAGITPIVLQKEIVTTGVCVYTASPSTVEGYEMYVLSLYGKLNEERAGILEELRKTRRAYAV